jgi:hypothetical protein
VIQKYINTKGGEIAEREKKEREGERDVKKELVTKRQIVRDGRKYGREREREENINKIQKAFRVWNIDAWREIEKDWEYMYIYARRQGGSERE